MPRGGGRSSSGSRSSSGGFGRSSQTATRSPPVAAPRPQQAMPMQAAPAGGGMMSGIGGMVVTGMAFGAGSEVAHQAVRGIMGSGGSSHEKQDNAP